MSSKPYHIVFATGLSRDLRYLAALIHSIVDHFAHPEALAFHIVHFQLENSDLEPLAQSLQSLPCKVEYYRIDETVGDKINKPRFGYWGRIWIPTVLDESIERALYLDCDMLCLQDLSELWNLDLGDNYVAAVMEPGARVLGISQSLSESGPRHGYEFPARGSYFNSGTLFMNLKKWRDENVLAILEERFDYRPQRFNDQDALNLHFQDKVIYLSPEWNLVEWLSFYEDWDFELYQEHGPPEEYFKARIRHYSGKLKPDGPYVRQSQADDFYYYLDRTAWRGWRSEAWFKWYRPILGNLMDFHYFVVRGLKQGVIQAPWSKIWELLKKAPYAPILYPFFPIYLARRPKPLGYSPRSR